jgi:hypothetical protein
MMNDVRQFLQVDLPIPWDQAIAYIMIPAKTNRAPAIRNGGIVSIENRMPRYVEPQITYNAVNAMITSAFFGAAMGNDNVAFRVHSNRAN